MNARRGPTPMTLSCTIADLPPPPPGRHGWPWTDDGAHADASFENRTSWPRISLVTPSFNQGAYLEETIRSVLLQGYPNLEYHIIDGGSIDESVAIIRKYEPWLASWISERDRGQSDAINKGFARSSGEIFNWLCSDDLLEPRALHRVAKTFLQHPECGAVVGDCRCLYEHDPVRTGIRRSDVDRLQRSPFAAAIWQPSCFFRRELIARRQLVLDDLHYCMDRELWCYLHQQGAAWRHLPVSLSVNRFTGANKSLTGKQKVIAEIDLLYRRYTRERLPLSAWLRHVWLPLVRVQKRHPSPVLRAGSRVLSSGVSLLLRTLYPVDRLKLLRAEYYGYEMW
jgi:Glycosyltransferases involved in cell wall biogenesis